MEVCAAREPPGGQRQPALGAHDTCSRLTIGSSDMLTAKDVMTVNVVTVPSTASMNAAIDLALRHRVSGLPVLDAQGRLEGMITEFGMLAVVYDATARGETVAEHMTRTVLTVTEDTPLAILVDKMILHRIKLLPVTGDGRLVGIVSRSD